MHKIAPTFSDFLEQRKEIDDPERCECGEIAFEMYKDSNNLHYAGNGLCVACKSKQLNITIYEF